jgi:hypothetical protein
MTMPLDLTAGPWESRTKRSDPHQGTPAGCDRHQVDRSEMRRHLTAITKRQVAKLARYLTSGSSHAGCSSGTRENLKYHCFFGCRCLNYDGSRRHPRRMEHKNQDRTNDGPSFNHQICPRIKLPGPKARETFRHSTDLTYPRIELPGPKARETFHHSIDLIYPRI